MSNDVKWAASSMLNTVKPHFGLPFELQMSIDFHRNGPASSGSTGPSKCSIATAYGTSLGKQRSNANQTRTMCADLPEMKSTKITK